MTNFLTLKKHYLYVPLILAAGAAQAGGLADPVVPAPVPVPPPPPPVVQDWTGPYVGAQFGTVDAELDGFDGDLSGQSYGVHAGYLFDFGSIVAGAEIDYDWTNVEETVATVGAGTIEAEIDYIARAKLRVGYDAGSLLPYLTGGIAQMQISSTDEASDTGTFIGGGVEYRISPNVRLGAEFLQHQFEEFDDGGDIDANTISLRASYQF